MFAQGDRERYLGLPISPFCDRTAAQLGDNQKGFLRFVCEPQLTAFDRGMPPGAEVVVKIPMFNRRQMCRYRGRPGTSGAP